MRMGRVGIQQSVKRWKKPNRGWIKCNVDGSFVNSTIPSKAGWVFRDSVIEGFILEGDCQKAIDLLNRKVISFGTYNWIREALW